MGDFPDWIITVIPVSVVFIIAVIFAICFCTRMCWRCKPRARPQTAPQSTDGPIHDPGIYNESFTTGQPVFTIPGSAFMPYNSGLPVNYVISTTRVITITADTDDEGELSQPSTIERARRHDERHYDNGVTLAVSALPSGPPRYGSLYFCPPPDYEEALEITDVDESSITYL